MPPSKYAPVTGILEVKSKKGHHKNKLARSCSSRIRSLFWQNSAWELDVCN